MRLKDREQSGFNLVDPKWLINKEQVEKTRRLARKHDVTPGELYREALEEGLEKIQTL